MSEKVRIGATLGHRVSAPFLLTKLGIFLDYWEEQGREPMMPVSDSAPCLECGRTLFFEVVNGVANLRHQFERWLPEQQQGDHYRPHTIPLDTRCPCEAPLGELVVPFECTSGKVVLANDLRKYLPWHPSRTHLFAIDTELGRRDQIIYYAVRNVITDHAYACVDFWKRGTCPVPGTPADADLVVTTGAQDEEHEKKSHWQVSMELWAFMVADAGPFPEAPKNPHPKAPPVEVRTDSYDRPLGYLDLPVGHYQVRLRVSRDDDSHTIRPVAYFTRVLP